MFFAVCISNNTLLKECFNIALSSKQNILCGQICSTEDTRLLKDEQKELEMNFAEIYR